MSGIATILLARGVEGRWAGANFTPVRGADSPEKPPLWGVKLDALSARYSLTTVRGAAFRPGRGCTSGRPEDGPAPPWLSGESHNFRLTQDLAGDIAEDLARSEMPLTRSDAVGQ
jgi:hypothetical protein